MKTEIDEYIQQKIKQGEFQSRDEFLEVAVSMYRDLEEHDGLRAEIDRRLADVEAGRVGPLDIASLKSRLVREHAGGAN